MYVCVYIYTQYGQTDGQTDTQTDTRPYGEMERLTGEWIDLESYSQRTRAGIHKHHKHDMHT